MNISNFIQELKRRNVFKVAAAYAIAGWLIIQIATSVFPAFEFPGWTTQFVIILVGIGFPLALIFAWAFELTPEGLKKSQEVEITESVTNRTGKKLNGIIITVLSMGLVFVLVERVFFAEAAFIENASEMDMQTASIAVLPFVNMSSDEENEYFSDGLSEELLNALAKVEQMQVAGRTSSFKFKGQNENLTEIGKELGVANILEGSVRKSGNRLRITAQLIRVSDGFHMWSETYDRELTANDIFDIQEEISRNVMQELKVRLLPKEDIQLTERPTLDIEAYNAYLEATQIEINRSPKALEEAISKYNDAIRIDPTFAEAYARLSMAYFLSFNYGYDHSEEKREETKTRMRESIDQAQLLDANLGTTYQGLGMYFQLSREFDKSETAYLKAVELLPNDALAHNGLFVSLRYSKKDEEAYRVLEKAYHLDPLNPVVARNYATYLIGTEREFDKGLKIIDQIIKNYPDYMPIKVEKAWLLRDIPYGRQDEAFTYMYEAYKDESRNIGFVNQMIEIALDVELYPYAEHLIDQLDRDFPNIPFVSFGARSKLYAAKGEYPILEKLVEEIIEKEEMATREIFEDFYQTQYLANKKYKEVLESVKITSPELFFEEPEVADSNAFSAGNYIVALVKTGDAERARIIANKLCKDVPKTIEDLEDGRDISLLYVEQIRCHTFIGEYSKAVDLAERLYFEENSKANWPSILAVQSEFLLLSDNKEFIALRTRVFEDLHRMRANLVQFLKKEGEWKEEWEEN